MRTYCIYIIHSYKYTSNQHKGLEKNTQKRSVCGLKIVETVRQRGDCWKKWTIFENKAVYVRNEGPKGKREVSFRTHDSFSYLQN